MINAICPYEGFVSMGFICAYGIGDALVTFGNGKLIDEYGAEIQPYAAFVASIVCLPLILVALFFHHQYELVRDSIMIRCSAGAEYAEKLLGDEESA